MTAAQLPIGLSLRFDPPRRGRAKSVDLIADAVAEGVRAVLVEAGLDDVRPNVSVTFDDSAQHGDDGLLAVAIEGRRAWFNEEEVIAVATETLGGGPPPADDRSWDADQRELLASWCAEISAVAVRHNADLLLTDEVIAALIDADTNSAAIVFALRATLGAGGSIAGWREAVDGLDRVDGIDLAEELIAVGGGDQLGVLVNDEYLTALLLQLDDEQREVPPLAGTHQDLFGVLGFDVPVGVRPVRSFSPGTFRVTAGLRWSAIRRGLPPGSRAVDPNDPGRLGQLETDCAPVLLPGGRGKRGVVLDASRFGEIEEGDLTWDPFDFLALSIITGLRALAGTLVNLNVTSRVISEAAWDRPVLTNVLSSAAALDRLTSALRRLADAGLPLGGDPVLLEASLGGRTTGEMVTLMRAAVPFRLQERVSGGGRVIPTYLLAEDLDEALREPFGDDPSDRRLVQAIVRELAFLPPGVRRPALLTTIDVRDRLELLVNRRFPGMPVIAHSELPPDALVQPIARVQAEPVSQP